MNPAWMHSYEGAKPYSFLQTGFEDNEAQTSGLGDAEPSHYYEMGEYSLRH